MIWLKSFSFILILILSKNDSAEGKNDRGPASPWANKEKTNKFIECLTDGIAASSSFPQQEKEDMKYLVETFMSAMDNMKEDNSAQMQAMDRAFATSIAKLVVAENADEQVVSVKTEALVRMTKSCFQSAMQAVDMRFINEMQTLIQLFAKEGTSDAEESEVDQEDTETTTFTTSTLTTTEMPQLKSLMQIQKQMGFDGDDLLDFAEDLLSEDVAAALGLSSYSPGKAAMPPNLLSTLIGNVASALSNSTVFKSIFESRISTHIAARIAISALQTTLSKLKVDPNTSVMIRNDMQSSLLGLEADADATTYAMKIAESLIRGLSSGDVLTEENSYELVGDFISVFLKNSDKIAVQFQIRISEDEISNDINDTKKYIQTSINDTSPTTTSEPSTTQAPTEVPNNTQVNLVTQSSIDSTKQEGLKTSGELLTTGQLNSIALSGGIGISQSDTSAGIDNVDNLLKASFSKSTIMPSNSLGVGNLAGSNIQTNVALELGASSPVPGMQSTLPFIGQSWITSGEPSTIGILPLTLSVITNSLASALASSIIFKSIFSGGISTQVASRISASAIQSSLLSDLTMDYKASLSIANDAQKNILNLGTGADISTYAMGISKSIVSGLSSSGLLTSDNASDLVTSFVSGYLQFSAGIAAQFGIWNPQSSLFSDINNVSNLLRTSISKSNKSANYQSSLGIGNLAAINLGTDIAWDLGVDSGAPVIQPSLLAIEQPWKTIEQPWTTIKQPSAIGLLPSVAISNIVNNLASALASSITFKSIFSVRISTLVASKIATSAIQSTLLSALTMDYSASVSFANDVQKSILNLGTRADADTYAMTISRSIISGLFSNGVLTQDNASDLVVNFTRGFLQVSPGIAAQFGIVSWQSDSFSDINNVSSLLKTSIPKSISLSSLMSSTSQFPASFGNPAIMGSSQTFGTSSSQGNSISVLSSPVGLSSPSAAARIEYLTRGLLNVVGPNGFDANSLTQYLSSVAVDARKSGLSASDAKTEALLETMVALLQIASVSQIGPVYGSATSLVSNSLATALSSSWA